MMQVQRLIRRRTLLVGLIHFRDVQWPKMLTSEIKF